MYINIQTFCVVSLDICLTCIYILIIYDLSHAYKCFINFTKSDPWPAVYPLSTTLVAFIFKTINIIHQILTDNKTIKCYYYIRSKTSEEMY
jgi:hypothetical protein